MNRVFLILLLGVFTGCQNLSSSQRYDIVNDIYIATVESVENLSQSGNISLDNLEKFNTLRIEANEMLNIWYTMLISGNGDDFDIDKLNQIIDAMILIERGET